MIKISENGLQNITEGHSSKYVCGKVVENNIATKRQESGSGAGDLVHVAEESTRHAGACETIPAAAAVEIADFDTALHLAGYGRFTYCALVVCSGAFFAAGVQNALSSYALPASACELQLSTYRAGLVNVAFMCGGVASAFLWGIVADVFGIKRTLILTLILDAVLTLAQSSVNEFEFLVVARAFNGFLIGGPSTLVMTYLSDLVGEKRKQLFLDITGLSFMMAGLLVPAAAWLVIPYKSHTTWRLDSWRLYLAICSIPGFLVGGGMLFLPESPRLLLDTGRGDAALRILASMFRANTGRPEEEYLVKKLVPDTDPSPISDTKPEQSASRNKTLLLDVLRQLRCLVSRTYAVKSTLIGFIFFANMAAGFGLSMWIPELLVRMKTNTEASRGKSECGVTSVTARVHENNSLIEVPKEEEINETLRIMQNMTMNTANNYFSTPEYGTVDNHSHSSERLVMPTRYEHNEHCKDNLDAEVYTSGLIVGVCCVVGNLACACLSALGSRGVRRAGAMCALVCAVACVGVFACVCACAGNATAAVAAVAALNAAALNGNVLLIRLLLYALPPRLSALGVCWGAWWGRAGGVASNLAIGALLDVSCAAPFLSMAALLALSAVGVMLVRDAKSDMKEELDQKTLDSDKEVALDKYITTHM